jgi:ADP-ribose pyrophosphatase YjhB (NUDIX family)
MSEDAAKTNQFVMWIRELQAIAQTGLAHARDQHDLERYQKLRLLAAEMLAQSTGIGRQVLLDAWQGEQGYATPKIDVRGAVFRDDKVLLVREKSDGKWTLPGGWADVNDSPSRAVERETYEESGFLVRAVKLAAVYDRNKHPHPPFLYHSYKLFFICDLLGGAAKPDYEIEAVDFFTLSELPELSTMRVLKEQILRMYEHSRRRDLPTDFD